MSSAGTYVLIVEDNPNIRSQLVILLVRAGYACVSYPSIAEALAFLSQYPVALILTEDFRGSTNDVLGPTAPLRHASVGIPLVLLTDYPLEEQAARDAKITAVLCKPFDIGELIVLLARLLRFPTA